MTNPFHFRPPQQDDVDGDGKTVDDWEDNPLSNALAWASSSFVPFWCQDEQHWTGRLANYLYTSCPCCMIFRGLALGCIAASIWWSLIAVIVWLLVRS